MEFVRGEGAFLSFGGDCRLDTEAGMTAHSAEVQLLMRGPLRTGEKGP